MTDNLNLLTETVAKRIEQRRQLSKVAQRIVARLSELCEAYQLPMVGSESEYAPIMGIECRNNRRYDCVEDEKDCPPSLGGFQCPATKYVCGTFICKSDYTCSSPEGFNYICATAHGCPAEFACDGGHVHWRTNLAICGKGGFDCSAGGQQCNDNAPYFGEEDPPDGGPAQPGDFRCGYAKDGNFRCAKDFTCSADDDFDCSSDEASVFKCIKNFTCKSKDDFYCKDSFLCRDGFACENGTDYSCESAPDEYNCSNAQGCLSRYEPPEDGYYKKE